MRPIKFRGKMYTGEFAYGDYCKGLSKPDPSIRSWELLKYVDVAPESVAQLVGYDRNGCEVYEGDKLINDCDNTTFKAAMNHIYTIKQYRLLEAAT